VGDFGKGSFEENPSTQVGMATKSTTKPNKDAR